MEATLTITAQNQASTALKEVDKDLNKVDGGAKKTASSLKEKLSAAAKRTVEDLKKIGKGSVELGKNLKETGAKAAELAAKLTAAAGAIGYGFKRVFVDVAAQAEDCGLLLNAALGQELGDETLKKLRNFSAATGLELQGVTQSFLALNRAGITPTQENMTALADLAASQGKAMNDVAASFEGLLRGQAGGLEEFGIKSEQVGERLVLSYKNKQGEMVNLAAKVNDPENLALIMNKISQDKAGGMQQERGQTFSGMISKLKSGWLEFVTLVMDSGPFRFIKEQLENILGWIDKLKEDGGLQKMAQEWGDKISAALKKIKGGLELAWATFEKWRPTLTSVFNKLGGFKTMVAGLAIFMAGPLVASIGKSIASFALLAKAILASPIGLIVAGLAGLTLVLHKLGVLTPLIEGFKEGFMSMSESMGGAFQELVSNLSNIFGAMGANLTDVNGQLNPEGWRELGRTIGVFTSETLVALIEGLAKGVKLFHDFADGIGLVISKGLHGDADVIDERNAQATEITDRYVAARKAGDTETMQKLRPQMIEIASGKKRISTDEESAVKEEKRQAAQGRLAGSFGVPGYGVASPATLMTPAKAMTEKPKPQEVKTEVEIKLSGTVQTGLDVAATSNSPNTTVSDKTRQAMGARPL